MKKQVLKKTIAFATLLLAQVGTVNAQVEVYDFTTLLPDDETTSTHVVISDSKALIYNSTDYYYVSTMNGVSLNNRLAVKNDYVFKTNKGWLPAKYNVFAICGLKAGDMIQTTQANTFQLKQGGITGVDIDGIITSGALYTIAADGDIVINVSGNGGKRFSSLKIFTSITLGPTGYATYGNLTGATLALPSGLKAYVVNEGSSSNKNVATLEEVSNIPAGVGVILKGTAGETYTLSTTADAAATFASNNLVAVTSDITLAENTEGGYTNFILGADGSDAKFYRTSGTGILKAGKAYLHYKTKYVDTGSESRGLTIVFADEETTGIFQMENSGFRMENSVYNLQGQRVNANHRGLLIKNGKKLFVK